MITDFHQLDLSKQYTYVDYLSWQFNERVELLRGWVFKMSPVPNVQHQRISGAIFSALYHYLADSPCQVFSAPFDVRLPLPPEKGNSEKVDTVVQPDICVICDPKKLDSQGCLCAPDIVVEILSPGNTRREMKDKLELYQNAAVLEYWVVDPDHEFVLVYSPDASGQYVGSVPFTEGTVLFSKVLPGFRLDTGLLFKKARG